MELSVVDSGQRLLRRAWIEVKIGSRLASERAGSSTTAERRSQLARYRSALDARDAVRGPSFRSPLAVLLPWVDEKHERQQIEETGTTVVLWQTVAELAAFRAHQIAGDHWRRLARQPTASLELANLETLVWLLEKGTTEKGTHIMGLGVNDPLDEDLLAAYASAGRALAAVNHFLERLGDALEQRKWEVAELYEEDDGDENEDEEDLIEELTDGLLAVPPHGDYWWEQSDASIAILVLPADVREEPPAPTPTLVFRLDYEGVDGSPALEPEWLERLQACRLDPGEDPDTGRVSGIDSIVPLRDLLPPGNIATDHAAAAADWIEAQLRSLRDTPPR